MLSRFARAALVVAATLSLALPVSSREMTDDEYAALEATIAEFDAAMKVNDMERVIATIPPGVLASIAESNGVDVEQLRAAVIEQSAKAMESVTIVSFGMDLENGEFLELADGTPYALVPTETVMDAGSGKLKASSDTLALLDEDTWYLLRVDDAQQVEILRKVYPGFAGVEFAPGTLEPVE